MRTLFRFVLLCLLAASYPAGASLILDVNLATLAPGSSYQTSAYNGAIGTVSLNGNLVPVAGTRGAYDDFAPNSWENNGTVQGYNGGNMHFSEIGDAIEQTSALRAS